MANGIIGGRSNQTIYGGRAVGRVGGPLPGLPAPGWSGPGMPPTFWPNGMVGWPRAGSMCQPLVQCCCLGPWSLAPGEVQPLVWDWSSWINSEGVQGYTIVSVASASLTDPSNGFAPADPNIIKVTTGIPAPVLAALRRKARKKRDATGVETFEDDGEEENPNEDATDYVSLLPQNNGIQVLIEASPDARLGAQFKLDACLTACDGCGGRLIRQCGCVVITIAEC